MPIIIGLVLAFLMTWAIVSFFFVRCPEGFVLVVTRRPQIAGEQPIVTFVRSGTVCRTFSVAGISTLDLRRMTVEAFVPTDPNEDNSSVMHAQAVVRIGTNPEQLESAAARLLGMTQASIGNIVEGVLSSSLHDIIRQHRLGNAAMHLGTIESQVTKDFADVLQTMGLYVIKLNVTVPNTRGFRSVYRKLGAPTAHD